MTTRLRQARHELGWSQDRVIRELRKRSAALRVQLGSDASVKTQISRHENGRIAPDRDWRHAYRLVYGRTDRDLGFADPDPAQQEPGEELSGRLAAARSVSLTEVSIIGQQVGGIRALDRQLGAPAVLEQLRALMATTTGLLAYSLQPGIREPLAAVLADAGALAGWQALDVGSLAEAWQHFETAKAAAREARSDALLAHAMGEQSFALLDAGDTAGAAQLTAEARSLAQAGPPLLAAWLHAAEAETHAAAGNDNECRRALDAAAAALPADTTDPDLPFIFLSGTHLARWRGNCLARLGDPAAIEHSLAALAAMDATFTRAEAGLRCDLAQAMLILGEHGEAAQHLRAARELVLRVGSVRQGRRAQNLAEQLTREP